MAGFYTPEDPDGDLDYDAYVNQLDTGDRVDLKPDEVLLLQNHQLGKLAVEHAERKLGEMADTSEGRAFLSRLRSQLKERYPGYLSTTGVPKGVDLERQLAEFRRAANDPRLRDHPVSAATREWFRIRDTAESFAKELPGNVKHFGEAQAARPIRDWMRAEAERIIEQFPEWAPVYDRVFSREMTDDDLQQREEPEEFDLTQEPDWSMD